MWCQFGVINEEGARIAEDGGVTVIMDRCLKVEHARYVGRMHWLGFNTQRVTAVRGGLQGVPEPTRHSSWGVAGSKVLLAWGAGLGPGAGLAVGPRCRGRAW